MQRDDTLATFIDELLEKPSVSVTAEHDDLLGRRRCRLVGVSAWFTAPVPQRRRTAFASSSLVQPNLRFSQLERSVPSVARNAVYSVRMPNSVDSRRISSTSSCSRGSASGWAPAWKGRLPCSAPAWRTSSISSAIRRLAQSRGTKALRVVASSKPNVKENVRGW
ncbi:MAG: hypothetical protein ACYTGC_05360, partial [Planctomycetota bacterium]